MARSRILHGDCLARLKGLPANSVDSIVTDPPYGWGFMGSAWDSFAMEERRKQEYSRPPRKDGKSRGRGDPSLCAGLYNQSLAGNRAFQKFTEDWAREAMRVLKPGGHMLVFCGPRTYHRMAAGVEDAGFEIRDQIQWIFGSGFPKSLNVGKQTGLKEHEGMGTALKPANEPVLLARKPIERGLTIAQNVLKHRCGALAIDASRIGHNEVITAGKSPKTPQAGWDRPWRHNPEAVTALAERKAKNAEKATQLGRWPANLVLSPDAAKELDRQSGTRKTGKHTGKRAGVGYRGGAGTESGSFMRPANEGGVSRYFYVCKPSRRERNLGCEGMPKVHARGMGVMKGNLTAKTGDRTYVDRENHHPTVKPITLMRYLIRMVTPPGGLVLDPFAGSGTTGCAARREGFAFIGIEQDASYVAIARARIRAAKPARSPEACA